MSADWIKMRCDLFTHPKVVRISSALKADTLRTVGGLMSVWCLFDAHSEDGSMVGYTCETLDDHLRWPGFAAAMMAVGWLSESAESLDLPRFETHNGTSAKRRAQDADRKKEVRKTSASEADKMRTREEKRREENKEQEQDQKTLRRSLRDDADTELAELLADIPADLLRDYKKVRKAKKAALTARAVRGLIEAGRKGGKTLLEVLEICCAESWVGYNHTWQRANARDLVPAGNGMVRAGPESQPNGKTVSAIIALEGLKNG